MGKEEGKGRGGGKGKGGGKNDWGGFDTEPRVVCLSLLGHSV